MKRTVTQEDLDLNPSLVEQGIEVGEEIEFPDTATDEGEGGPGGTKPPGNPPPPPPPEEEKGDDKP